MSSSIFSSVNILQNIHDHIRRVSGLDQPYELMILNFSRLMPYYRQGKFITAAQNYIEDNYAVQGKAAFNFANMDIVLIYEATESDQRENMFFHLRELFAFDLMMNIQTFGKVDGLFMQVFSLRDQQAAALHELDELQQSLQVFEAEQATKRKKSSIEIEIDHDNTATYVNPSDTSANNSTASNPAAEIQRVTTLAGKYRSLDIAAILSRELVIRHDPSTMKPYIFAFSQLDPALHKLMSYKDQRVDSDNALMNRYLGHVLHFRLLDFLTRTSDKKLHRDIAFPVHPELVLDSRFKRFEEQLTKGEHRRVILQFSLADIYNDYRLFYFARQHLRKLGFRLALSEVSYEALETIDLDALGLDFLFLRADADWAFFDAETQESITREIAAIGVDKIVLTNCIHERAVTFAQQNGIKLLCGAVIREQFDRSRIGEDYRDDKNAHSLSLGENMRKRSSV